MKPTFVLLFLIISLTHFSCLQDGKSTVRESAGDAVDEVTSEKPSYLIRSIDSGADDVTAIDFSADGKLFATGHIDHTIRLWNTEDYNLIRTIDPDPEMNINDEYLPGILQLVFCEKNNTIISLDRLINLRVIDYLNGTLVRSFDLPENSFFNCISEDGLNAGILRFKPLENFNENEYEVAIISTESGDTIRSINVGCRAVVSIAISHNREFLAGFHGESAACAPAKEPGDIKIWSIKTGKEIKTIAFGLRTVNVVTISPDDKYVASTGHHGAIQAWEIESGKEVVNYGLTGHDFLLLFSPDQKFLAGGDPEHFRVIKFNPGGCVYFSRDETSSWAFSTNEHALVIGRPDGSIDFLNLDIMPEERLESPPSNP